MALSRQEINDLMTAHQNYLIQLDEEIAKQKISKNIEVELALIEEKRAVTKKLLNELQNEARSGNQDAINARTELLELMVKEKDAQDNINKSIKDGNELRKKGFEDLSNTLKLTWDWLMKNDKIIRQTTLNLGLSGAKAEALRESFYLASQDVFRLGGGFEDIQAIQQGFSEETGRARVLTSEMVKDVFEIAKGTGIGAEQATLLASQFEFMGMDTKKTHTMVQGIVDTSERMGINAQKVIKNLNDNFKKINTYNFKVGTKGILEMAFNAEKLRVSMTDALNVSDKMRTLEGAIESVAQLSVMGGEFSKIDMFEAFYVSRNEPEKWTKKISEMTRGIVTFRKNSEGVLQTFISPADRQRLEYAAKALGMTSEEMTIIAQKRAELDLSERQLAGKGLTSKQKEWIQGAMKLNTETGRLQVSIGEEMVDISNLTKDQAKAFEQQSITLRDRAKAAQTFDDALKATIEEFKSVLLPILDGINFVLRNVRSVFMGFNDVAKKMEFSGFGRYFLMGVGILGSGFVILKLLTSAIKGLISMGRGVAHTPTKIKELFGYGGKSSGGGLSNTSTSKTSAPASTKWWQTKSGTIRKGAPELMKAQGTRMLKGGAGVGLAAAGVGAGIGIAAVGIGKLAESMAKLDKTQIWALPVTVLALAAAFYAFTPAIIAVGTSSTVSSVGLLALGGAVLMIGAGIGIAALGIGKMGEGLSKLVEKGKDAGWSLLQIGAGIAAINVAMASTGILGAIGGFLGGFKSLSTTLTLISENAAGIEKVGNGMKNITTALSGNKEDFVAVQKALEAISKIELKPNNVFSQLAELLKKPLKVQFEDKEVALNNNVTLYIDKEVFMNKIYSHSIAMNNGFESKQKGIS